MTEETVVQPEVEVIDPVDLMKDAEWHKAEGKCSKCNLKGFTKMMATPKDERFTYTPCHCLNKTLHKNGISYQSRDVEYKVVMIEHVQTMIARRRPAVKANPPIETAPAIPSTEAIPVPA